VPVHTHRWSSVVYVASASDFIRRDGEGNSLLNSRTAGPPPATPTVQWTELLPPHSVENISNHHGIERTGGNKESVAVTQNVELLASYWTIAGGAMPHTDHEYSPFDFKDRVEAAARAGFKGMGIWHADLDHILKSGSLKEMKRILDDNGMKYLELEFLKDWFVDGEKKKQSDIEKKKLLEASAALDAKHIKVGDFDRTICPMPRLIESFAQLCTEAANYGATIGFELMPFAMIDTLKDALAMVEGAGAKNGGIILDTWHLAKLGIPFEEVARMPKRYLISVELNDGTYQAPWSLFEDTINHRRLCGEGEFEVPRFIECVLKTGYTGPFGIEVLCQELRQMPLGELTARAFSTTMSQFS
jgi:sugar phosphate isomerase/epimerase